MFRPDNAFNFIDNKVKYTPSNVTVDETSYGDPTQRENQSLMLPSLTNEQTGRTCDEADNQFSTTYQMQRSQESTICILKKELLRTRLALN